MSLEWTKDTKTQKNRKDEVEKKKKYETAQRWLQEAGLVHLIIKTGRNRKLMDKYIF